MSWIARLLGSSEQQAAADRLVAEAGALLAEGRMQEARIKSESALAIAPRSPAALQLRGIVLCSQGDFENGLKSLREAALRDSRDVSIRLDLANALQVSGDNEAAEIEFRDSMRRAPNLPRSYLGLGSLLLSVGRAAEALPVLEEAERLAPGDQEITRCLALAVFRCHDYSRATELFGRPESGLQVDELNCLGVALQNVGDLAGALATLERARMAAPIDSPALPVVTRNLAYAHLMAGDWTEGFRLHESRQQAIRAAPATPESIAWLDFIDRAVADVTPWDGASLSGRRILVWAEQGLGDVIMLLRLLPVLKQEWQAATVSLLCPEPQVSLGQLCDGVEFLPAISNWCASPANFDVHCSIFSLPYFMGITPERVPGRVPYFRVSEERRCLWAERVEALAGMKVGLAWAGNAKLPLDCLRSMALDELQPVLAIEGINFISLQKDDASRAELRERHYRIADWMDECQDLVDTAALIANTDLIISVDTAIAHLAGALGKPVWLLNRFESEWRWMRDREDTVWYPAMRLFNQPAPRDWQTVIANMAVELRAFAVR